MSAATHDVRVLAYHALADHAHDLVLGQFSVPPAVFARQIDSLLRAGCNFISGDQFLHYLWGRESLPARPLLLTFDDCYADLLEAGLPLLQERGIPAIAFAVAGEIGGSNSWDAQQGARQLPLLDAAGLRKLAAAGVEIGAHGCSHRPLPDLPAHELAAEITESLDALEACGLPRPRFFAYPYGASSRTVFQATVDAKLLAAFSVRPGIVDPAAGHFLIPRFVIFRADRGWRLRWKLDAPVYRARVAALRRRFDSIRRRLRES
jgi:peptidoglycan/xylan/chitin deacetylase (PgdA/CDA1 family)